MYEFKIKDEPFACGYLNSGSDSIYISTGAGYIEAARAMEISFDTDTGFPNLDIGRTGCFPTFYAGQSPALWLLLEKAEKYPEHAEDYRYIAEQMKALDLGARILESFTENENDVVASTSGWGGTWGGHALPDLCDFARLGTDGLREKISRYEKQNPEKGDFYKGLLLTLDAIDLLCERIYDAAAAEYEKSKSPKLERILSAFGSCPRKPAKTFASAVCVYVVIVLLDGIDSPGHFDQYMIDFWNASDREESRGALEDLWLFFKKTRTWNLCISGSDENGEDLTNELSYEILRVARKYGFETPNLTMRCHEGTPEALWDEAVETILSGIGMPALYNDGAVCRALENIGISKEDSHRYAMNGCNQIDIQGKSHMGLEDGEINMGLALSYALNEGMSSALGKQVGAATPPAERLDTFERFRDALRDQIKHLTKAVCSMANKAQRVYARYSSNPIRSMTIEGCIERGLDYKNKGPVYGHGQILLEGVPDCIDSVANIKKFVYEDKRYTLAEVRDAMLSDYEGYEEMYYAFRNSGLNFGNDIPFVDEIAADIVDFFNAFVMTIETERGGVYTGGCSPFNRAAVNGGAAGALPNGKRAGETLYGDSIGATPGKDVCGPTALLNSCLVFDHTLPCSGFILNLKFARSLCSGEKAKKTLKQLARAYFKRGGQQLQITVADRSELIDALEHPDKHRNLIVRVGGFSAYFTDLSRELQENVISRTEY